MTADERAAEWGAKCMGRNVSGRVSGGDCIGRTVSRWAGSWQSGQCAAPEAARSIRRQALTVRRAARFCCEWPRARLAHAPQTVARAAACRSPTGHPNERKLRPVCGPSGHAPANVVEPAQRPAPKWSQSRAVCIHSTSKRRCTCSASSSPADAAEQTQTQAEDRLHLSFRKVAGRRTLGPVSCLQLSAAPADFRLSTLDGRL